MQHFKFKFSYRTPTMKSSGNGTCKGETIGDAWEAAQNGVAKDMGVDPERVNIVNLTQYTPKKAK